MKKKLSYLFIPVLAATLACSTAAFPAPDPTAAPSLTASPAAQALPLSQTVTLTSIPLTEEGQTPPYTITAQTPNLVGNEDPRALTFNTKMIALVQSEIEVFKSNTLQYATDPPLTSGSFLDVQYALIGQAGNFWSIKLNFMGYADGAAHPYHYSLAVNYDLDQGREVALDEIFLPGSDYLTKISDYCKAELATRDIAFDMFSQGADPLPENYQRWNISHDGLVITFDEYQVAAYAAGPQIVVIPFDELEGIINHQSAIAPFLP